MGWSALGFGHCVGVAFGLMLLSVLTGAGAQWQGRVCGATVAWLSFKNRSVSSPDPSHLPRRPWHLQLTKWDGKDLPLTRPWTAELAALSSGSPEAHLGHSHVLLGLALSTSHMGPFLSLPGRPQNGSIILYNRKKVKYRKDGYCWKKRKDGKTTREDHMKLKVKGVEVRDKGRWKTVGRG